MKTSFDRTRLLPSTGQTIPTYQRSFSRLLFRLCLLCMLGLLFGCSKQVTLQSGLSDSDANEIVLVLSRQGIMVEKQTAKEGVNLVVTDTDLSRATAVMNAAGLPRRGHSSLGDVFKKEGMISTPLEERVRYLHGLSEELGFTLQQFDNVISARVHVVLPERIAPGEPVQPSSAAVFVKYRPPLDEDAIAPRIRRLVAAGIPGLSSEDGRSKVSVVMTPGEAAAPMIAWTTVGPFMVAVDSAGSLLTTLILFGLAAVLGLGALGMLVKQNMAAIKAKLNKTPPAAEDAPAAEEAVEPAPAS